MSDVGPKVCRLGRSGENVYENNGLQETAGGIMRPGGMTLTERAINYCALFPTAKVLDVGCGPGFTAEYLQKTHDLAVTGIDVSEKFIREGRKRSPELNLIPGNGDSLPFADSEFDCVITECSLSVMPDSGRALAGFNRVLVANGKLAVTDIYIRARERAGSLRQLPSGCCVAGAGTKDEIIKVTQKKGFTITHWEDHSGLWKQFVAMLIMQYGSLAKFWQCSVGNSAPVADIDQTVTRARLGYFLMIAEKTGGPVGGC